MSKVVIGLVVGLVAVLFVGCASESHVPPPVVVVDDAPQAQLERAIVDLAPATDAALAAWLEADMPLSDPANCPALHLVAVRAPSADVFATGRYCAGAATDALACYRPLQAELVLAPATELDAQGEPAIGAVLAGLARCEGVPVPELHDAAHEIFAE